MIELEERIAAASEKGPTSDSQIKLLRTAINCVREEFDIVVKDEEKKVRDAGGLHVIGTERHESRRVDNQLRGRAGRQGDPGSTRFFLSLEDNLLRIFGGDRVAGLMNAFRVEDDMPIESGMLTRSLEGAQKRLKLIIMTFMQVFEYDEVLNNQRRAVYSERRGFLEGHESKKQVLGYGQMTMSEIVYAYAIRPTTEEWDLQNLLSKAKEFISSGRLSPSQLGTRHKTIGVFLAWQLRNAYDAKESLIEQHRTGLCVRLKDFILHQIDILWREHLQAMDALRESVGLRGYGQKDPLIEYKNEGYDMFLEMMTNMRQMLFILFCLTL